jgi:single-stranded DNA-binding protein
MLLLSILGNLGRDAEVKRIGDKDYISFSVASTEKQGETENTTWVSVLASHNPNLLPFLKKGQQVFVSGRMKAGIYQADNKIGIDVSVFAQTLQLCGSKKEENQQPQAQPAATPQQTVIYPDRNPVPPAFPPTPPDDDDNGLPF